MLEKKKKIAKTQKVNETTKIENETTIESFGSVGRVIIAETGNIKMLVIPHLTGSRISIKNMDKIKKILDIFLT